MKDEIAVKHLRKERFEDNFNKSHVVFSEIMKGIDRYCSNYLKMEYEWNISHDEVPLQPYKEINEDKPAMTTAAAHVIIQYLIETYISKEGK